VGAVIVDACLIITFGNIGELGVVAGLRAHQVLIGSRSRGEVTRPPASSALASLITSRSVTVETVDVQNELEQAALVRFDGRLAFRGRGDAELLALAVTRGWIVGSDERAIRSAATAELGSGRVAGTVDFLRWAVAEGRLAKQAAAELVPRLDVGAGILKELTATGRTLAELF